MLSRDHEKQRWLQTTTASRDEQWQVLLKPPARMCTGHFSLFPFMAIWEPLISFCGGVFVVQLALCRAHMLLKSVESSKSFVFSPDGSYCKCLSGSLG